MLGVNNKQLLKNIKPRKDLIYVGYKRESPICLGAGLRDVKQP